MTIGSLLLLGLFLSAVGKRTFLPRVTLLLLFGILVGQYSLDLIPPLFTENFALVADMTLVMIGFLLGGKLHAGSFSVRPAEVLAISVAAALVPTVLVAAGLWLLGVPPPLAIMLGTVAAATAPAAVLDVVKESGRESPFSELLLSIVAIDDVWGLLLFSVAMAIASSWLGNGDVAVLPRLLHEIGGSVLIGTALGLPAAWLTGRIKRGKPMFSEAVGLVFLCGGLALWFETSLLIAPIVMGAIIANLARHHDYAFHQIENVEWSMLVVFFVLAGATLELPALMGISSVGLVYVLCRGAGKLLGAWAGAALVGSPAPTRRWVGMALLPHAGVAIGMALVASNFFPEYRDLLLPVVISATVVFELLGPLCARLALRRVELSS
jgi:Kef-type K+ transport system membrane component KefB